MSSVSAESQGGYIPQALWQVTFRCPDLWETPLSARLQQCRNPCQ
jgi:hypothetical protein